MSADDLAVTEILQGSVLALVGRGAPALASWEPYDTDTRCTAILDATTRVVADPAAQRRRAWDGVVTVAG
jgi:para-nitrobenzyl esterase